MAYRQEFEVFCQRLDALIGQAETTNRKRIRAQAYEPWMTTTDIQENIDNAKEAERSLTTRENELRALVLKLFQERDVLRESLDEESQLD